MDIDQALQEVDQLGGAYFWDADAKLTSEEILEEVRGHILSTRKLTGLDSWKRMRDGLRVALNECSEEKLDQMVIRSFNLPLQYVGGRGRNLLERAHQVIAEAIQERERFLQSL